MQSVYHLNRNRKATRIELVNKICCVQWNLSTCENYDIVEQNLIINFFSFAFVCVNAFFRMPRNREVSISNYK